MVELNLNKLPYLLTSNNSHLDPAAKKETVSQAFREEKKHVFISEKEKKRGERKKLQMPSKRQQCVYNNTKSCSLTASASINYTSDIMAWTRDYWKEPPATDKIYSYIRKNAT